MEPHEIDPVVEPIIDWEQPLPLTETPVPAAFPLEVLPRWGREWVEEISIEKNASLDIAANLFIAVGGGGIARNVVVSPWEGYYEPTNVYVIAALAPGQKKSPIFKEALRPVRTLERERMADWTETQKLAELAREMAEKRRKALLAEAAEAEGDVNVEDLGGRIEHEIAGFGDTEAPPLPRLTIEDVTPEKLAELLGGLGRIIAASDEGSAFFENLAGRYSRSTSWDVFNKAHSAGDLIVDRKASATIIMYDPALTLAIATQPKMLRDLWEKPGAEGRGVLARPLYALPAPIYTAGRTPAAPQHVRDEYDRRIRRLYEDTPELAYDDDGHPRPTTLKFDPEGETLFELWAIEINDACRDRAHYDDDDSAYIGWLSKLAGQTARLAAILHVTAIWTTGAGAISTTITAETVADAITLARYYRSHALAAFGLMGELPHQRLALRLLNWIDETGRQRFTTREAHRPINNRTRKVDQVRAALGLLETHGYIRPATIERRGPGRPPETWVVNPLIPRRPQTTDKTDKNRPDQASESGSVSSVSQEPRSGSAAASSEQTGEPEPDPPPATVDSHAGARAVVVNRNIEEPTLDEALADPKLSHAFGLDQFDAEVQDAIDPDPGHVLLERHEVGPHAIELWGLPTINRPDQASPTRQPAGELIGTCMLGGGGVGSEDWIFGVSDGVRWRFTGHTLPGSTRLPAPPTFLCSACAVHAKHGLITIPDPRANGNPNPPDA